MTLPRQQPTNNNQRVVVEFIQNSVVDTATRAHIITLVMEGQFIEAVESLGPSGILFPANVITALMTLNATAAPAPAPAAVLSLVRPSVALPAVDEGSTIPDQGSSNSNDVLSLNSVNIGALGINDDDNSRTSRVSGMTEMTDDWSHAGTTGAQSERTVFAENTDITDRNAGTDSTPTTVTGSMMSDNGDNDN